MAAVVSARHRTRSAANGSSAQCPSPSGGQSRIEVRPLASLKAHPSALRKHPEKQLEKLRASITAFGFNSLLVIEENGTVIAGHARLEAAKRAGVTEARVLIASHLNETQRRAFRIADNKLYEDGEWNDEVLRIELAELSELKLDFSVELTGFSTAEIDVLLEPDVPDTGDEEAPLPVPEVAISRHGDLWQLGSHMLICGDARDPATYQRLLAGHKAVLVVTDPPYNVPVDGHVSGLGRITHREFAMASGEMSRGQFTEFLAAVFGQLAKNSLDGALHFHFMDHRHIEEMAAAGGVTYTERKNILVWVKTNAGMGSMYRSQHELIFVYKHGTGPHVNNVQLGANGRYRTNVLEYPGVNTFGSRRAEDLARHPTPKPVALIADLIRDASRIGDLVLDCFAGGGTIFVAAEKTGRRAAGIEIDPLYCDLAIQRWQKLTGTDAIHVESGKTYEQLSKTQLETAGAGSTEGGPIHGAQ